MKKLKIIISPSKTFNLNISHYQNGVRPKYINDAKSIFSEIRKFSLLETKQIYKLSDKKAKEVYEMHQEHGKKLYPAIFLYYGTVFKQLDLNKVDWKWANEHLLIIDALYGVIKPLDLIAPYRLDFNVKFPHDLKSVWKDKINHELKNCDIINLASSEFSDLIEQEMIVPIISKKEIKKHRGIYLNELLLNKKYKK